MADYTNNYDRDELTWLCTIATTLNVRGYRYTMTYMGTEEAIQALVERATDDGMRVCLKKFIPTPHELELETVHDKYSEILHPEHAARREKLRKIYGAADYVEWRLKNWGIPHDTGTSELIRHKTTINLHHELCDLFFAEELMAKLNIPDDELHCATFHCSELIPLKYLKSCGDPRLEGLICYEYDGDSDIGTLSRLNESIRFFDDHHYCSPGQVDIETFRRNSLGDLVLVSESLESWIKLVSADVSRRHKPTIEALALIVRESVEQYMKDRANEQERFSHEFSRNSQESADSRNYFATMDIPPPPAHISGYHAIYALNKALSPLPNALKARGVYWANMTYTWTESVKALLGDLERISELRLSHPWTDLS